MRLLVLTGSWPTKANTISGVFVEQQCSAFINAGCSVRVGYIGNTFRRPSFFLSNGKPGCKRSDLVPQEIRVNNLPEQLFWLPGAMTINADLTGMAIASYLKKLQMTWRPDAVLVHGIRYNGLSAPYWRSLIEGRVVQVVHGVDPKLGDEHTRKRFGSLIAKSVSCFESTVMVGNPLLAHAVDLGIQCASVVPNGTDVPPLHSIDFSQRPLSSRRILLSVSNLDGLKGIDLNMRALAKISQNQPELEWEYRIVGDGSERTRLDSLKVELGLVEKVNFLGRVNYVETMIEMGNCDIFCLPSWGEAFGIVYLEAMARGRPVIGCWRNGAQDIITNETDGLLVEPQDVGSLSRALVQLLSDPEECSRLGRNARATAERFTWDANAQRMLRILGLIANQEETEI